MSSVHSLRSVRSVCARTVHTAECRLSTVCTYAVHSLQSVRSVCTRTVHTAECRLSTVCPVYIHYGVYCQYVHGLYIQQSVG